MRDHKIDWRFMFKGVLSRMRDAGESNEMGARWMATEAEAAVFDLTAERDRLREENERLRGQLVRMADIAEMRLMAIHKALEPASFGVNGIESPEDGINYMSGVLRAALSPVEEGKP